MKPNKSIGVLILFCCTCIYVICSNAKWDQNGVLKYDVAGYYLYLPASFIYHDPGKLAFYPQIDSLYHPSGDIRNYAQYDLGFKGRKSNKYPPGVALGELPVFLLTDFWVQTFSPQYPRDGYSPPYEIGVSISCCLWSLIGLWALMRFLLKHFTDNISTLCLLIIGFGTNLFCYSAIDLGMSHPLSFMLFSLLLLYTDKWYRQPRMFYALFIGLCLGWIAISRPVNLVVGLIPLLWPIAAAYPSRWACYQKHRTHLLAAGLGCLSLCCIQIAYWHYTTGHFLHFSYTEEHFDFFQPHILDGLFSYKKGWFVYTPLALIALFGLIPAYRQNKQIAKAVGIFFLLFIYVVFSWWNWWYGWSFGARAMIESYAIMAIPLAYLMQYISRKKLLIKALAFTVFSFGIWLNLYQTAQYSTLALPGEGITKAYYWRVWNRLHVMDEDYLLLEKP